MAENIGQQHTYWSSDVDGCRPADHLNVHPTSHGWADVSRGHQDVFGGWPTDTFGTAPDSIQHSTAAYFNDHASVDQERQPVDGAQFDEVSLGQQTFSQVNGQPASDAAFNLGPESLGPVPAVTEFTANAELPSMLDRLVLGQSEFVQPMRPLACVTGPDCNPSGRFVPGDEGRPAMVGGPALVTTVAVAAQQRSHIDGLAGEADPDCGPDEPLIDYQIGRQDGDGLDMAMSDNRIQTAASGASSPPQTVATSLARQVDEDDGHYDSIGRPAESDDQLSRVDQRRHTNRTHQRSNRRRSKHSSKRHHRQRHVRRRRKSTTSSSSSSHSSSSSTYSDESHSVTGSSSSRRNSSVSSSSSRSSSISSDDRPRRSGRNRHHRRMNRRRANKRKDAERKAKHKHRSSKRSPVAVEATDVDEVYPKVVPSTIRPSVGLGVNASGLRPPSRSDSVRQQQQQPVQTMPDRRTADAFVRHWKFYLRHVDQFYALERTDPIHFLSLNSYYAMLAKLFELPAMPSLAEFRARQRRHQLQQQQQTSIDYSRLDSIALDETSAIHGDPEFMANHYQPTVSEEFTGPSDMDPKTVNGDEVQSSDGPRAMLKHESVHPAVHFSPVQADWLVISMGTSDRCSGQFIVGSVSNLLPTSAFDKVARQSDLLRGLMAVYPGPMLTSSSSSERQLGSGSGSSSVLRGRLIQFCSESVVEDVDLSMLSVGGCDADLAGFRLYWHLMALLVRQYNVVPLSDVAQLISKEFSAFGQPAVVSHPLVRSDSQTSLTSRTSSEVKSVPAVASLSSDKLVGQLRLLVLSGDLDRALDFAVAHNLWDHALFLASRHFSTRADLPESIDRHESTKLSSNWERTVSSFLASTLAWDDPLRTAYDLLDGRVPSVVSRLSPTSSNMAEWPGHLAVMLAMPLSDVSRRSVAALACALETHGLDWSSKVCRLLTSRMVDKGVSPRGRVGFSDVTRQQTTASWLVHCIADEVYAHVAGISDNHQRLASVEDSGRWLADQVRLVEELLDLGLTNSALAYADQAAVVSVDQWQQILAGDPTNFADCQTMLWYLWSVGHQLRYTAPSPDRVDEWLGQVELILAGQQPTVADPGPQHRQDVQIEPEMPASALDYQQYEVNAVVGPAQAVTETGNDGKLAGPGGAMLSAEVEGGDGTDHGEPVQMPYIHHRPDNPMSGSVDGVPPLFRPDNQPVHRLPESSTWSDLQLASALTSADLANAGQPSQTHQVPRSMSDHHALADDKVRDDSRPTAPGDGGSELKSKDGDSRKTSSNKPGFIKSLIGRFVAKNESNECHLPADDKQQIIWDEKRGRWVDADATEEELDKQNAKPPPPTDFGQHLSGMPNADHSMMAAVQSSVPTNNAVLNQSANRFAGGISRRSRHSRVDAFKQSQAGPSSAETHSGPPPASVKPILT